MNAVLEAMKNRKSVRAYEREAIPRNIIETVIEAGNQAPCTPDVENGVLIQPWRFVVVEDPKFRQKLVQNTLPLWRQSTEKIKELIPEHYGNMMSIYEAMDEPKDMVYYSAPVIIFVLGSTEQAVSCALACENIMLAAHSLGLGSCYSGYGSMMIKDNAEIMKTLELKNGERIYGPILIGYPKDMPVTDKIRWKKKRPRIKWI